MVDQDAGVSLRVGRRTISGEQPDGLVVGVSERLIGSDEPVSVGSSAA